MFLRTAVSGVVSWAGGCLIATFYPLLLVLIRVVKERIKPGNLAQLDSFRLMTIAQDGSERKRKQNFLRSGKRNFRHMGYFKARKSTLFLYCKGFGFGW